MFEDEGNPGNNILPRIPDIGRVFEHPAVAGALTSLLGPRYNLNPHRHCHLNRAGSKGQSWHKDCYVYDHNLRHPRFYWVLAFYYPQDTTPDMGPSGVLPRTQFYRTISDPDPTETREEEAGLCGPPARWPSFTSTRGIGRFRMSATAIATCSSSSLRACGSRARPRGTIGVQPGSRGSDTPNPEVSSDVWDWLRGNRRDGQGRASAASAAADGDSEAARLEAAYQLAGTGAPAVPELVVAMRKQTLTAIEETTAKTPDNAHGTNPTPGPAATALTAVGSAAIPALTDAVRDEHWWVRAVAASTLARMGAEAEEAVPALMSAMRDEHWWVRRNAAEGLGMIGAYSGDLVRAMSEAVGDSDYRVRRNAALALAKIGPEADAAVPDILPLLSDENRYNRFYGGLALRKIGSPRALQALLDSLFEARWCPLTSPKDTF